MLQSRRPDLTDAGRLFEDLTNTAHGIPDSAMGNRGRQAVIDKNELIERLLSEKARLEVTTERLRGDRGRLRQQLAVALAADQTSREALTSLSGAVEQLRDGIAQRDAQIRDLLALHQFRATAAERERTQAAEPTPDPPRSYGAGDEAPWRAAVAEAVEGAEAERDAGRRAFRRAFSGAERETAQLAIAAVDAVADAREMVAEAFAEGSRAAELCARRERELRVEVARAQEEARRARRGEASAIAQLQAAPAHHHHHQHQRGRSAASASPSAHATSPTAHLAQPSPALGSSPFFSFRTATVPAVGCAADAPSGGAPASKAGRGPVHVQLSVRMGAHGAAPGQLGVVVALLVDWAVRPTWESAEDQLKEARFNLSGLAAWRARRGQPEALSETLLRRQVAGACHRAELAMGRAQQELWRLREQRSSVAWRALASGMLLRRIVAGGGGGGADHREGGSGEGVWAGGAAEATAAHSKAEAARTPHHAPPPTPRLHYSTTPQQRSEPAAPALHGEPTRRPPHLATPPTPSTPDSDSGGTSSPESSLFAAGGIRAGSAAAAAVTPAGGARHRVRPSPLAVDAASRETSERVLDEIEALLLARRGATDASSGCGDGRSSGGSSGVNFGTSPGGASDGPSTPDPLAPLPLPLSPDETGDHAAAAADALRLEQSSSPPLPPYNHPYGGRDHAPHDGIAQQHLGPFAAALDALVSGRRPHGMEAAAAVAEAQALGQRQRRASPLKIYSLEAECDAAVQLSGTFASVAAAAASFALAPSPQRGSHGVAFATDASADAPPLWPVTLQRGAVLSIAPAAALQAPSSPQLVTPARGGAYAEAYPGTMGAAALGFSEPNGGAVPSSPLARPPVAWGTAPPAGGYVLSSPVSEHSGEGDGAQQQCRTAPSLPPSGLSGGATSPQEHQKSGGVLPQNRELAAAADSKRASAAAAAAPRQHGTGPGRPVTAAAAAAQLGTNAQQRRAQMLTAAGLLPGDWESLTLRDPPSEEHSHSRRYGATAAGGLGTVKEMPEAQPPAPATEASGAMPVRRLAYDDARDGPTPERYRSSPMRRGLSAGSTRSQSPYLERSEGTLLRFPTRKARDGNRSEAVPVGGNRLSGALANTVETSALSYGGSTVASRAAVLANALARPKSGPPHRPVWKHKF